MLFVDIFIMELISVSLDDSFRFTVLCEQYSVIHVLHNYNCIYLFVLHSNAIAFCAFFTGANVETAVLPTEPENIY